MDVRIRKAEMKDLPGIVENWKELMHSNVSYNRKLFRLKPNYVALYKKFLKKQLTRRNACVYVAGIGGSIAGHVMVDVKKTPNIYLIDKEAYVGELFVKSRFRRRGIGTLLLAEAEKWARKKVFV